MQVVSTQNELIEWASQVGRPSPVLPLPERLQSIQDKIVRQLAEVCRYAEADSALLFNDMVSYIEWSGSRANPSLTRPIEGLRSQHARIEYRCYPVTVICLPSNATVPLAGILAYEAEQLGASVVLSPPAGQESIVLTVLGALDVSDNVAVWMGRSRDLVAWSLAHRLVEQIYFLGASTIYPQLAMDCARAGTQLRFEGQGDGMAYVGASADLISASKALVEAKRFCEGRMCSSPSGVLLHRDVVGDFLQMFEEAAASVDLREPLELSVTDRTWRAGLQAEVGSDWTRIRRPTLIARPDVQPGESFSPVAWWSVVSSIDELRAELSRTPYRLQVSYFGSDAEEEHVITSARFARVCLNMNPADQDPILPWGNYGLSGDSPLMTFGEKLQFTQLVEGTL